MVASSKTSTAAVGDDKLKFVEPRRMSVIRPPSLSLKNLRGDLTKLWQYRDLLYTLSLHRVKVRYKQSVLGILWALLQPLSMMLIFTFIFSIIARISPDGAPSYAIFVYAALLPWNYFSSGVGNATNSLVSHSQFVTKVYFPREILPVTYVIAALFDFLVASTLLAGLMINYHVRPTANAFYAVPIILVVTMFSLAMSFFFSATQVRIRDVGVAVPLLLQLWMFATPIIYPLSAVPRRLLPIYELNPMVGVIENFREVILRGGPPDFQSLLVSAIVSIVLLFASYIYFKHVEATMADVI